MNHATRQPLYKQIEAERKSRVVSFITGERVGLETQIANDAVSPFVSILDNIGPTKKISLILETTGGHTSAAWRLINLIKSFCDELEVIIPTKAMSAGTLMALGAQNIVMTKQAALGPIDPSLANHPLAPVINFAPGRQGKVSVSAEAVRGYIDEIKKDISDPTALSNVWINLARQIHPLILGDIFRVGEQIRSMASELIGSQVSDSEIKAKIIQLLCSDSGSHDYTLNRRKAKEIGLKVEKPGQTLYNILLDVTKSFGLQLETLVALSPQAILGTQTSVNYLFVRGLIESADECYGFASEGTYVANVGQPPIDQRIVDGWRKLP